MSKIKLVFLGLISSNLSFSAISVDFNSPFAGGVTGSFADASGDTSAGLIWGIAIDVDSDSTFGSGTLDIISNTFSSSLDVFVEGALQTGFLAGGTEGDFLTTESVGSLLGGVTGIDGSYAGMDFSIIWFDRSPLTAGSTTSVGLLTDSSFVLPADGSTVTLGSTLFTGADPVRTADTQTLSLVPEPTSAALAGLAGLAFLVRRKRA